MKYGKKSIERVVVFLRVFLKKKFFNMGHKTSMIVS